MLKRFLSLGLLAVTLLQAPTANAAPLVSADLFAAGDGLITRESSTGREWLDLTVTVNQSVNSLLEGYGGFAQAGFRVAFLSEIGVLFSQAGITDFSPSGSAENLAPATALMDLVGCIGQCATPYRYTEGFAFFDDSNHPYAANAARANFFIGPTSASVAFGDGSDELQWAGACDRSCASVFEGVWLVRDGQSSPVSEPSSLALLLAGAFALWVASTRLVRRAK